MRFGVFCPVCGKLLFFADRRPKRITFYCFCRRCHGEVPIKF